MRRAAVLIALGLLLPALADEVKDWEAAFSAGEAAIRDGRYEEAFAAFQKARGLSQSFGIKDARHIRSLAKLSETLTLRSEFDPAEEIARKALSLAESHLGPEAPETARSLAVLADALSSKEKDAEAEPLYQRSLDIRRKVLGEAHPDTAEALGNLGMLRMGQQKYREAEQLFTQARAVYQKAGDAQKAATMLNNLAYLHQEEGKNAQAEKEYRQCLEARERALRPEHPDIGVSCSNLATALSGDPAQGDEAERLLKRALKIAQAMGPDNPDVGYALNNLAFLNQKRGDAAKAEPLYRDSLRIWEKCFGPDSEQVAITIENLAVLMEDTGRADEAATFKARVERIRAKPAGSPAEAWAAEFRAGQKAMDENRYGDAAAAFERALEKGAGFGERDERNLRARIQLALACRNLPDYPRAEAAVRKAVSLAEAALGPDTLEVADGLNVLALILDDTDRSGEAEPFYQRALLIRIKALGAEHPEVATSLNNLAFSFLRQQKFPEAEKLFRKAVGISEKSNDQAYLAFTLNNLGSTHEGMKQVKLAEEEYRRSLAIYEKLPGNPGIANTCFNLGNLLQLRGDFDGSIQLLKKAIEALRPLGEGHPQMAKAQHNLAVVTMGQNRDLEEADRLFRASRATLERVYGPDHPEVASSLDNHARLLDALDRKSEAEQLRQRVREIRAKRR